MRQFQVVIKREFRTADLSVVEMTMILEDHTGDAISDVHLWARSFVEHSLAGYYVDSIREITGLSSPLSAKP